VPAQKKSDGAPQLTVVSVAIGVSDRRRALGWCTKTLGLDAIDQVDHYVTVGRRGKGGLLHPCPTSEYDPSIPLEKGNAGIQLSLPGDFPAACATLAANGVKFRHPAEKAAWGWWAMVEDPDGNELTLTPER
jgi:catechol 2,3-dioxygenase-like lactoylglutathione lyase family enzyme